MSLETWVSLATLVSVVLALGTAMLASFHRIDKKLDAVRDDLKSDIQRTDARIDACRVELKEDIQGTHARIDACRVELKEDIQRSREESRAEHLEGLMLGQAGFGRVERAVSGVEERVHRLELNLGMMEHRLGGVEHRLELAADFRP